MEQTAGYCPCAETYGDGCLNGELDGYTAERVMDGIGLLDHDLPGYVETLSVLDGVKAVLRALKEDGTLQPKQVQIGNSGKWFYRPVP